MVRGNTWGTSRERMTLQPPTGQIVSVGVVVCVGSCRLGSMTDIETPVVNVPLLRKAVEWAEAEAARGDESEWDQWSWRNVNGTTGTACGTTYCIAGWTCYASGEEWVTPTAECILADGKSVKQRADELLGLSCGQSEELFSCNNSIGDVRRIAEDIAGEKL